MPTAQEAAAANLAWRAVNAPQTVTQAEQAQANAYATHYWNVERPQQEQRDYALQQTIFANRQMINRQEGLQYGGTHTLAQARALTGSSEAGTRAFESEREYYNQSPSAEYLAITGQYAAMKSGTMVDSRGAYWATGQMQLSDPSEESGGPVYTGRAAVQKAAYDREVYGIGAPNNEVEYYRRNALQAASERPGFTAPETLGDTQTRQARAGYAMFSQAMALQGETVAPDYQFTGQVLEYQRQVAYGTPSRRDETFYMGELQKWAQAPVEQASAYHHIGMKAGVPIPANPFEYQADLAVEFLKGSPDKPSEFFSPVSGEMGRSLPGGEGVQEYAWREAVAVYGIQNGRGDTMPAQVSFMNAVTKLGQATGQYGPYGRLYGGPEYAGAGWSQAKAQAFPAERITWSGAVPAPFKSASAAPAAAGITHSGVGLFGLTVAAESADAGYGKDAAAWVRGAAPMFADSVTRVFASGIGTAPIALGMDLARGKNPAAIALGGDITDIFNPSQAERNLVSPEQYSQKVDVYKSQLTAYESDLAGYTTKLTAYQKGGSKDAALYNDLVSSKTNLESRMTALTAQQTALDAEYSRVGVAPSIFEKAGKVYEDFNQSLAPYTTDIVGVGRTLQSIPALPESSDTMQGRAGQVVNFTKGFVEEQYTHPADIALWYGVGKGIGIGERFVWEKVSGAAMREAGGKAATGFVPWAGRALSTNEAVTAGQMAKVGVGAVFLGIGVKDAIAQPTAEGKGKAFGGLALATWAGGAGMASNKFGAGVPNTYEYRTAIGGKRALPMLSEVRADTAAKLNEWDLGYIQRNPEAATIYRNAYAVSKEIRFEDSPVKGGNPVYEAINVPIEQQQALARAMKPTSQFGSAASHTQFPEMSQEPDVRAVQTVMIQTEQFRNAPVWEKKAMLDYEPAFANTGKATKSIKGMDIDAFGNTEQINTSLIGEKGSMVQVRTWETVGGQKTYLTEPSGRPATALVSGEKFYERGYVPEDVVSVSKGGATFQIDVKGVPEGYPRIKGYIEPTKPTAPYVNDARVLLGTRLLGSPFEVIPKEFDVIRGGTGKDAWMEETAGFQSQRLMEAAEKNLAGATERYAGDPFYRGNRLQKDTQRLLATQEELLGIRRARLEVGSPEMKLSPKDASRIGMAEKSLQTWRSTEFSYQLERMAPEGPATGYQATARAISEAKGGGTGVLDMFGRKPGWTPEPAKPRLPIDSFVESGEYAGFEGSKVVRGTPQALAETAMENYRMGMDIGGTEIQGPIRTGVGVGKMLRDYPAPKTTSAQDWLDMRAGMDPFGTTHAKGGSTKPKPTGQTLEEISARSSVKRFTTEESVARFLNKKSMHTAEPAVIKSPPKGGTSKNQQDFSVGSRGKTLAETPYKQESPMPSIDRINTKNEQSFITETNLTKTPPIYREIARSKGYDIGEVTHNKNSGTYTAPIISGRSLTPKSNQMYQGYIEFWGTSQKMSETDIVSKLEFASKYGVYGIPTRESPQTLKPGFDLLRDIGKKYGYDVGNPVYPTGYGETPYAIVTKSKLQRPPQIVSSSTSMSFEPKPAGKLLKDMPYEKRSTADSVARFLKKSGEAVEPIGEPTPFEPVDDTYISPTERSNFIINVKSPEVARPALARPFAPATLGSSQFSPEPSTREKPRAPYAASLESPRGTYITAFSGGQRSIFAPLPETQRSVAGAPEITRSMFGEVPAGSIFAPTPSAAKYAPSSLPKYTFPSTPSKPGRASVVPEPIRPYGPTGGSPGPQPPYAPESPGPYRPGPPPPYEPEPPTPLIPLAFGGFIPGGGSSSPPGYRRGRSWINVHAVGAERLVETRWSMPKFRMPNLKGFRF